MGEWVRVVAEGGEIINWGGLEKRKGGRVRTRKSRCRRGGREKKEKKAKRKKKENKRRPIPPVKNEHEGDVCLLGIWSGKKYEKIQRRPLLRQEGGGGGCLSSYPSPSPSPLLFPLPPLSYSSTSSSSILCISSPRCFEGAVCRRKGAGALDENALRTRARAFVVDVTAVVVAFAWEMVVVLVMVRNGEGFVDVCL